MAEKALITGATAGIGEATAWELARKGWGLLLTGRREERLQALKKAISAECQVQVSVAAFDIRDYGQCQKALASWSSELSELRILVNNAGLARGTDSMDVGDVDDWEAMIDTNFKGLLYITRLCLPQLKAQGSSAHIVNVGSISGHRVYPGGGVYCATKHAVTALSQGLRMDLHGSGVRVTNISPGMVETEFSEVRFRSKDKAKSAYAGMTPLTGKDIAASIGWAIEQPAHVNLQEMIIMPTDQASVGMVHRQS